MLFSLHRVICLILVSTNSSLVFPRYTYFWMKLITWYNNSSTTVADSLSFSMRCAADVSFSNRWKIHVFDIPKNWLTVSQQVREWNWRKHILVFFPKFVFLTLTILPLSICRYQSYDGEVKAKAYTIKINISVSFAFTKTGLLLSEQCSAVLVPASSWFDVKRLSYWDCDISTLSFSIFKVVRPIKSFRVFSCVRYLVNFFSSWDLFLVVDRNSW